jgi:hypothetical protein
VPRLYYEEQLPLRDSTETAVKIVGGWCEMDVSLGAEERPLLEDVNKQISEDRD